MLRKYLPGAGSQIISGELDRIAGIVWAAQPCRTIFRTHIALTLSSNNYIPVLKLPVHSGSTDRPVRYAASRLSQMTVEVSNQVALRH